MTYRMTQGRLEALTLRLMGRPIPARLRQEAAELVLMKILTRDHRVTRRGKRYPPGQALRVLNRG